MAAKIILGKPDMFEKALASFFASLFVGSLRYFLVKFSWMARMNLLTQDFMDVSEMPDAKEF